MKLTTTKTVLSSALLAAVISSQAMASSHRESPELTHMPSVDATDLYAFTSYEAGREDFVTFIANYNPLQDGFAGPNAYPMHPNAIYEIHVDTDGDAVEDLTYQFKFSQALKGMNAEGLTVPVNGVDVKVPLRNIGQIDTADPAASGVNFEETYTVKLVEGDRRTGTVTMLTSEPLPMPLDNIGSKSFADYDTYANGFIHNLAVPGCSGGKVFVGARKDPFAVNLGNTFDLVNYNPLPDADSGETYETAQDVANNNLAAKNVTSIALELHKDCLTSEENPVIGVWTTASLQQAEILNPTADSKKPSVYGGAYTQVSRLGMPLVNELVIGIHDKPTFNRSEPKDDLQFATYVTNPTLPFLLDALFRDAVGATADIAPSNADRVDLQTAFLTGFDGVNQLPTVTASEMLRLNTSVAAENSATQNNFGVVAGDLAGFPNGRRPGDDIVDIALRVVMGALCHPINVDLDGSGTSGDAGDNLGLCAPEDAPVGTAEFTDRAPVDSEDFGTTFPYLETPVSGND